MDTLSELLLTKNSLGGPHELSNCQSPLHLLTQPRDPYEGEVGSLDDRFLGLRVSAIS